MDSDRTWVFFWCKDYGGACSVRATVTAGGQELLVCDPMKIPISDSDGIASMWKSDEAAGWLGQFGLPALAVDLAAEVDSEHSDADGPDCDGGRDLPPHAANGDGLTVFQEYRGFIFDGGVGMASGGHRRLSTTRKELLVECSEMDNIAGDSILETPANPVTNHAAVGGYDLSTLMGRVSDLYRDIDHGCGVDIYWARDSIDLGTKLTYPGAPPPYPDRDPIFHYSGSLKKGAAVFQGGAFICQDWRLGSLVGPLDYPTYFPATNPPDWVASFRNPLLTGFVHVALVSRWANIGANPLLPTVDSLGIGQAVSYPGGVALSVLEICEEKWPDPHYWYFEFADMLLYCASHEIGHGLMDASGLPGWTSTEHFTGATNAIMNANEVTPAMVPTLRFADEEVMEIDLPASTQ